MPGAAEVEAAAWIRRAEVADPTWSNASPCWLHAGECEAIALAKEHSAQLLIDEIRGRRAATQIGIEVVGTLRILAEARKLGQLDAVRPIVLEMQSNGYRFERTWFGASLNKWVRRSRAELS